MFTRRRFLVAAGAAGFAVVAEPALLLPTARPAYGAPLPGGTLDPTRIPKYATRLVIPPTMPRTRRVAGPRGTPIDYYEIAVRQFRQQILPPSMPSTTVWSYGSIGSPATFNYPAFTIEAKWDSPVQVKWVNGLTDASGRYLPHLLAVDPTLHWANPPGGVSGRDTRPTFESTPGPYTGPVPIVTHLHGGHTRDDSDGFTEAWYLPAAHDIPDGYAEVGSQYEDFRTQAESRHGQTWSRGSAVFQYENDQPATTMWYHDHTLGMTRLNVYAGPAGFYLLRGGPHDLPPRVLPRRGHPLSSSDRSRQFEIPLAIQDRSFNADGSLFYPRSRTFFDELEGPFVPDSDVSPIWNPETFGNCMVVNGRTWPVLPVEPRRYRFRLLNGCNSRFVILTMTTGKPTTRPVASVIPFWQIGGDGGFLPRPVQQDQLLMAPAERADVVVDFTGMPEGAQIHMVNVGPDEPFGGGVPGVDFPVADPGTTGQVMKFVVIGRLGHDDSVPPGQLVLPAPPAVGAATNVRQVSLNELDSETLPEVGPQAALLGTLAPDGTGTPLGWSDPITERPRVGDTEVWEIHNFTEDAHPIHVHEVQFSVVDRQSISGGSPRQPEASEAGLKDTVIAYPGEITRLRARFELAGLYVWHCHIVEHEDHEMMRPYRIVP